MSYLISRLAFHFYKNREFRFSSKTFLLLIAIQGLSCHYTRSIQDDIESLLRFLLLRCSPGSSCNPDETGVGMNACDIVALLSEEAGLDS